MLRWCAPLASFAPAALMLCLAAAVVTAQDADEQNAQVQQYVQMLQPALWRELDFVRSVCNLAPPQRTKVKAAGDASVKAAAKSIAMPQQRDRVTPTSAAHIIRDAVSEALKKTLNDEQFANFSAEAERRAEAYKEATVLSAVAQLDQALYLTEEQREKIVKSLRDNWKREWEQWLIIHQYAGQYYPQVPDAYVENHLNLEQKSVWRGLQKIMIYHWGNQTRRPEDEAWWEGK